MYFTFGNDHVLAGMSERSDGSMIWWNQLPINEAVRQNRDRFFSGLKIDPKRVIAGGIEHGTHVAAVDGCESGEYLLNTDGLVTNVPGLVLTVTAADCLPVLFYDAVTKSVGIAHAGWRGLVAGILEKVVSTMHRTYGSDPKNISVLIGPHIKSCHYEIGNDLVDQFHEYAIERRDGKCFANLAKEAEGRLRDSGIERISIDPACTFCEADRLYSARHDQTKPLQGMVAYIGIVDA